MSKGRTGGQQMEFHINQRPYITQRALNVLPFGWIKEE